MKRLNKNKAVVKREIRPVENIFDRIFKDVMEFEPFDIDTERYFSMDGFELPAREFTPEITMKEEGNKIVIKADVPGFGRDDVKAHIHNNVLTISGKMSEEHKAKGSFESRKSEFESSVTLPGHILGSKLTTHYRNGELTVEVPRGSERRLLSA